MQYSKRDTSVTTSTTGAIRNFVCNVYKVMIAVIRFDKRINFIWAEIINNNKTWYCFTREHYCFFVVRHAGTSTAQHARHSTSRHVVLWRDATSGIGAYRRPRLSGRFFRDSEHSAAKVHVGAVADLFLENTFSIVNFIPPISSNAHARYFVISDTVIVHFTQPTTVYQKAETLKVVSEFQSPLWGRPPPVEGNAHV